MMKHLLKLVLLASCIFSQISAEMMVETTAKTKDSRPWKFEIKNHDSLPLYIQIRDANGSKLNPNNAQEITVPGARGNKEEERGYLRIANIDPTKEITVYIFDRLETAQERMAEFKADHVYIIAPNPERKIIALTYDKKEFRPQTGKFGGSSQSGLNLYKNVKQNEIKPWRGGF